MDPAIPTPLAFPPSDRDLIVHYSRNKIDNMPLPWDDIIELDFYSFDPDELTVRYNPLNRPEAFYFTRRHIFRGLPRRVVTNVGYWKAAGLDHSIPPDEDPKVGYWRPFVFRRKNFGVEEITDWGMHEYRASFIQDENYVICKVFSRAQQKEGQKKRKLPEDESSSSKPYKKAKLDQDLNVHPFDLNVVP